MTKVNQLLDQALTSLADQLDAERLEVIRNMNELEIDASVQVRM